MINWASIGKRALHPTKVEILEYLEANGTASPKQMADALDMPLENVSYHVRDLADSERWVPLPPLISLAGTQPVRGALEHFYRLTETS
jgi:DNA-binding transcriptional ArsR family regulator